ncbi:TIGR02594 family protein [Xanthobacteraceae bacterium Astr-EGSB]|uniref:NlpC/P60 family protein n=1 Tax=Astrobacterium formosum TaxID=3069710 RepID=UPI0027AE5FAE|nr:TIGR02594 family protein [Xanthobacteraceae bacterium Astr-EGSB]
MILSAVLAGAALRQGASGDVVRRLQLALRGLGYPLSGTGYFGPATDTAVEDFQRRRGLAVDGIVGEETAAAIEAASRRLAAPAATKPAPLWLLVALSHVGLEEGPGGKNNPELVDMLRTVDDDYRSDATPWCGYYVGYCLAEAGLKPSSSTGWALSYAQGWGVRLAAPALGAVAVKSRAGGGHVTFVAGRTKDGRLACCGGNQNDRVSVAPYAASAFDKGFWWPRDYPPPAGDEIGLDRLPRVDAKGAPVREA